VTDTATLIARPRPKQKAIASRSRRVSAKSAPPPQLTRGRLSSEVAQHLREAIVSGRYSADQRLAPSAIAQTFGVSPTPVTEALMALQSEGLVRALPRRGFRVAAIQRQDVADAFQIHAFVAGMLAEAAAAEATDNTVKELEEIQRSIEALIRTRTASSSTAAKLEEQNFRFHSVINHVADRTRLRWFLRAATHYVPRHYYEAIPGALQKTLDEHPAIIEALRTHNRRQARALVERHVAHAGELLIEQLALRGFWGDATSSNEGVAKQTRRV